MICLLWINSFIKYFLDENGNGYFIFSMYGKYIEVNQELNHLGIKTGDVIHAEQI